MRRSVKSMLAAIGVATIGTAVLLMGGAILVADLASDRTELLDKLSTEAALVANFCTAPLVFKDRRAAVEALQALDDDPSIAEAAVFDNHGDLFGLYRRDGNSAIPAPSAPPSGRSITGDGARVVVPVTLDGETVGSVALLADTSELKVRAWHFGTLLVGIGLLSMAGALVLLMLLQRAITSPLRALAALTREVASSNDYALRAADRGPSEVGVLAGGINDMLAQLQARDRDIAEHQRGLEREVERRTLELARTNAQLEDELGVRERAEAALREALQQWSTTFDAIHDAVLLVDAQGQVVRCNRAFSQRLGDELPAGASLGDLLRRAYGAEIPASLERIGRDSQRHEQVRPIGTRWFEVTFDPVMRADGESSGGVVVLHDVTEQRSLQEQLVQAQKMEAIGRLAAGIAHDFNNVLASILAYSGFLIDDSAPGSSARSDAEEIQRAAQRAADLTRQLLAFSRKQMLKPTSIDAGERITELSNLIRRLIGENIETRIDLEAGVGHVLMDATQFEQVLINLSVNARDAMPRGGRLTIRARNVVLEAGDPSVGSRAKPGSYVVIAVEDTGSGIAPDVLARLYEPFFTTKAKGKGTGLGLAMVYGAVQAAGGAIDVTTAVGSGSCFSLYLPRVERGASVYTAAKAGGRASRGSGERVLLVEDDPQVRRALRKLIESNGYTVIEACNGEEGLALAEQDAIAVVVSDIVMPQMDGLSMGRLLRDRRPELPIIFMSGYFEVAGRDALLAESEVLTKPFTDAALIERIRDAIARRAAATGTAR